MTVNEAVDHVRKTIGDHWPVQKPIPPDLVAVLCDALWDAGLPPRINVVRKYFDNFHDRAFAPGVHAWQTARGLDSSFPRWANPNLSGPTVLAKTLWPAIAQAPRTCFDPANDGRWGAPHPKIIVYLCGIENDSLRNLLSLYALIKFALGEHPLYSRLSGYLLPLRKLLEEQGLDSVYQIEPDELLLKVCEGKAGKTLTQRQRSWIVLSWNGLYYALQGYAEALNADQLAVMSPFFVRPLQNRYRMNRQRPSILIRDRAQERVKAKSDVVHAQFHKLRFLARVRCNQARRLFEAVKAAITDVAANRPTLPMDFSYEESVATANGRPLRQRVLLTLWDSPSLWDRGHRPDFQSCFLSYSTKDQEFAERLYGDLQAKGIRCWFAPHDIKGGRKLHEQIDEAIRIYDRLLLILSESSMSSEWVKTEIANARQREIREKRQMLFPISLVPFAAIKAWHAFDADTGKDSAREVREYFIPDFSNWKDHDSYQKAFERLLTDLKAKAKPEG